MHGPRRIRRPVPPTRLRRRPVACALAPFVLAVIAAASAGQPVAPASAGRAAADDDDAGGILRRLVARFDFEEAADVPPAEGLPPAGFLDLGPVYGFPPFGRIDVANDRAASGDWSLRFTVDGGSMAVGVPAGVIPIVPLADYRATIRIRTEGLDAAAVRLAAQLHDARDRPIPSSRAESAPVRSNDAWTELSVEVRGDVDTAAHLVVELLVVQPRRDEALARDPQAPRGIDVRGTVWFDDLEIVHRPRLGLRPVDGPVVAHGTAPRLEVMVRDLAAARLDSVLEVRDLEGDLVLERPVPIPARLSPVEIAVPVTRAGWYHARLSVHAGPRLVGRAEASFIVSGSADPAIPPPRAVAAAVGTTAFGVAVPVTTTDGEADATAHALAPLDPATVIVPVWPRVAAVADDDDHVDRIEAAGVAERRARRTAAAIRRLVDRLVTSRIEPVFALEAIPPDIARDLGLDPPQVIALFARPAADWQESLEPLLLDFGLRVRRWQLGPAGGTTGGPRDRAATDAAVRALASVLPDPRIEVPTDFAAALGGDDRADRVQVPASVRPSAIADLAERWRGDARRRVTLDLEALGPEFTPRDRFADLLHRGLVAWRHGAPRVVTPAPWRLAGDLVGGSSAALPEPAYAAWRSLSLRLAGRRFGGEVDLGPGINAWLAESVDGSTGDAMVIWRDASAHDEPQVVEVELGPGVTGARRIDAMGDARPTPRGARGHLVDVDDLPAFVESVDVSLMRFRSALRVDPPMVNSAARGHERELVIENPWPFPIRVEGWFDPDAPVRLADPVIDVDLRPGEERRVPVVVQTDAGLPFGPARLPARWRVTGRTEIELDVPLELRCDWPAIELTLAWMVSASGDLVLQLEATNHSNRNRRLDAFVAARGLPRTRRGLPTVGPGETVTRVFRVEGGLDRFGGDSIRYGVIERDGPGRLDGRLDLPAPIADRDRTVGVPTGDVSTPR